MSLRAFLPHLEHDPGAVKLADEGGEAAEGEEGAAEEGSSAEPAAEGDES